MSYSTCENALETIIKQVTGYSIANVTKGDYRILGHGVSKAVVLVPGAFTRNAAAESWLRTAWIANIELYVPFTGDISTIASSIRTERQAIIDEVDKYPTLNSATGVVLARITGGGEPEMWVIGNKNFWKQILNCSIEERVVVSYA